MENVYAIVRGVHGLLLAPLYGLIKRNIKKMSVQV
jgi:hypothetical protein